MKNPTCDKLCYLTLTAEVERARRLIAETCTGYTISEIDAVDDKIVYCGEGEHVAFVSGRVACMGQGRCAWGKGADG